MPFIQAIKYEHVIILLVCGILIGGILTQPPPRESFTEFFFTNPSNLQREVRINGPLYINFTVKNHEFTDLLYSYEMFLEYGQNQALSRKIGVASGKFFLPNNKSIEISEKIVVKEPSADPIRVSVLLFKEGTKNPYRSLQYWLNTTVG